MKKMIRRCILCLLIFVVLFFFLWLYFVSDSYDTVMPYFLKGKVRETFYAVMDFRNVHGRFPCDLVELVDKGDVPVSKAVRLDSLFRTEYVLMPIVYKPVISDKEKSGFLVILYFPYGDRSQKGFVLNWKEGDDVHRPPVHCYSDKDLREILSTHSLSYDEVTTAKYKHHTPLWDLITSGELCLF